MTSFIKSMVALAFLAGVAVVVAPAHAGSTTADGESMELAQARALVGVPKGISITKENCYEVLPQTRYRCTINWEEMAQ
jgi:hypothetical protein